MVPIPIPTNQSFLHVWYAWTHAKVSRHFKRDRDRIPDTVQNVRLRLLSKDFIGRWFFKHLREELVTLADAERILGGVRVGETRIPVAGGKRRSPDSLYRVQDLLDYAEFDYERYYYSMQGHTIDSDKVLRLIGGRPGQYTLLQSLWRQNRLFPAEFTEHCCTRRQDCPECARGRASLHGRKLTFAYDWSIPEVAAGAAKMRWNDAQLKPFLRDWRDKNFVRCTPEFIMRESKEPGIDAGLLRYAEMIIDNEVVNDFKRLTRHDDVANMVFNRAQSPELPDTETVAWESDDKGETPQMVLRDPSARGRFTDFDVNYDILRLAKNAGLTHEESQVVGYVDKGEASIADCAQWLGKSVQQIHKIRTSALQKMRSAELGPESVDRAVDAVCAKHGVDRADLFGSSVVGKAVLARTDLFSSLHGSGMKIAVISQRFGVAEGRVLAAINRAALRESRRLGRPAEAGSPTPE